MFLLAFINVSCSSEVSSLSVFPGLSDIYQKPEDVSLSSVHRFTSVLLTLMLSCYGSIGKFFIPLKI